MAGSLTDAQIEWTKTFLSLGGIDGPVTPSSKQTANSSETSTLATQSVAAVSSPAADTGPGQQVDAALTDLEDAVQALVPLGVPAKVGEARIVAYRARAQKADAKAAQALLKEIQ